MIQTATSLVPATPSPPPVQPLALPTGDPVALLRLVCDFMHEAVVVADATGKVVLIGDAARRLIGLAADAPVPLDWTALSGRYLSDGVTPVPADRLLVTRALRGEFIDGEIFCFRRDGLAEAIWVNGSARPIRSPDGGIQGCVVVWRDVTAQMRIEKALGDSEERFQAIFNGITDAAVFADAQRRAVLTNPAFCTMFGYTADEVRGRSTDFLYADRRDFQRLGQTYYHVGKQATHGAFEVRYRRKDGSEFWSETLATRIFGADGSVVGYLGLHRDITSRKTTEAALRRSEAEFRNMFELSAVGSAQADPTTGRLLRVNRKLCEITGYAADELLSKTFSDITHPDDREGDWQRFRAAMAGDTEVYFSDKRYVTKTGDVVWVNVQAVPLRDEQGRPIRTVAAIQDITARKQVEAALRSQVEMQGWLTKIAATVPGMICSFKLRPDGTVCMPYASSALDELYGLQPEDVREDATTLLALIHGEDIGHVNEMITASASTMTPWRAEFRVRHPRKGEIWVEGHSMPQREFDGSILWHGFVQDISERKRMEEALRDSERLYRAIGESIDYGVWVCAPDGRNIYASESFLKLVGLTQEQCSNFGWGDVLHPDDAERTIAAWKECVRTGATWDIEHRFRGIDGHWHDVLARGAPVRNERGEITYWAGINLDISRLKRVEKSLRDSEADLRRAQAVAQTGSWHLDIQRNELLWSDENHRIFNIPKGAPLTYETFLSTIHADDRAFVDRSWRTALRGEPYDIEHRIVVAGEVKWLRERAELEFDAHGTLRGALGTTQDISERKRSEAALAASEARFRLAMEAVAGVVYDWDRDADSIDWSSGLSRVFGFGGEDAESSRRWWRDSVHPEDRRRIRLAIIRGMKARRDHLQVEYRMRHSDGHWVHVADRAHVVRDAAGRAVRVVGSLSDISDRKEAEAALRQINDTLEQQVAKRTAEAEARTRALAESERFARATIDALSSTLCVLDASGHIIAVNKAWREFATANGGRADCLSEGADYLAVCDAAARASCPPAAEVARAIRAAVSGRRQDFSLEYDCHSPDERRWFVVKLTRFPGSGPIRLVVRHENITERKLAAEEQLDSAKRVKRLAAHLETVREEQSATIAREVHDELGGTLTMLKLGLATTVDGMPAVGPLRARFKGMLDQVDAALQTVKRISAGLRPAMLDTLGLIATINWYAAEFSRLSGITTELSLPEHVRLSQERSTAVFRIVQEALTNVAKHAGASQASITMRKHKGQLIVEVSDNGIGLTAGSLRKHDSFGIIGMHERAQYLGGRLSIAGRPAGGTQLSLTLPLEDRAAQQA